VIIGSGTAARAAGSRVRNAGWAVALADGLTTKDPNTMMFAYPTGASDIDYML